MISEQLFCQLHQLLLDNDIRKPIIKNLNHDKTKAIFISKHITIIFELKEDEVLLVSTFDLSVEEVPIVDNYVTNITYTKSDIEDILQLHEDLISDMLGESEW